MLMLDGESSTVFRWMGVYQKSEGVGVIFALQLQSVGILGCAIPIHGYSFCKRPKTQQGGIKVVNANIPEPSPKSNQPNARYA
jgi:hypothetical protein